MDDEQGQEEYLDDSSLIQSDSSYYRSEDSRFSEDSYTVRDNHGMMESNYYDTWEDDSYYDESDYYEDSTYDSPPQLHGKNFEDSLVQTAEHSNDAFVQPAEILSATIDISDSLEEENNNDPNNNMDSIEVVCADDASVVMEQSSESGIVIDRADSPRPGCSKDSLPLSSAEGTLLNDDAILERTRHVLHLISTIHRDSVFEAIKKNPKITAGNLKLWDLVPVNERLDFPLLDPRLRKTEQDADTDGAISTNTTSAESSGVSSGATGTIVSNAKRGPDEDICTVGCKKSSSNPEIAIAPSKIRTATSKSGNVSSHIPLPSVKVGQFAKARREDPVKHEKIPYRPNQRLPPVAAAVATTIAAPVVLPLNLSPPKRQIIGHVTSSTGVNASKGAIPKTRYEVHKHAKPQQQNVNPVVWATMHQNNRAGLQAQGPVPTHPSQYNLDNDFGNLSPIRPVPRETFVKDEFMKNSGKLPTIPSQRGATTAATAILSTAVSNVTSDRLTVTTTSQEKPQQHQQSTNRVFCVDIYYKLRNIFPNVDPDYIKKLCPPDWGPGDRDAQFTHIVEHFLERGDSLPLTPAISYQDNADGGNGAGMASGNVDDIYETLLGIFPDADPHYLRDFAEKNVSKPNAVKEFVESKLERGDYPTREMYLARLKITEQQRQYTTGFDIKQYLTIIPDPFKHFMDPKRKCHHSTVAFEFLKSYFNKIRVSTISKAYNQCYHNLSATAEALENTGYEMKSKRGGIEIPTEDIILLQEMAFIKHKTKIREYMNNVKRAEEAEFKMLKEQNFLVECQCCYDSECVPSKCTSCDNGHLFCNNCVITGTSSKMGEGETRISCFVNCGSEFSLSALQQVLAPTTFSILLKKRQAAEVIEAGLEGLVSCPFCHFASIPPEEDRVFKCLNPECTKESCRLCKELSHVPLKCDEVMKADKARCYIEERMTQALARKCYKCNRAFFKEEGCNKITCPCGAVMCYLCDQPIKDYTHFRGQGSDAKDLCPLYSDTIRLDAVAVRKVAEEAQQEVLKLNPSVKVDTTKLLPNIPLPTIGPHTAVYNADELPRRAHRVRDRHPL